MNRNVSMVWAMSSRATVNGLPVLADSSRASSIGMLGDPVGDPVQDLGALFRNQLCPSAFGGDGGVNGPVDIGCGTDQHLGDHRLVGWD